tara:strand:+ start:605 stop:742 length:138 start_codon:yes stop_codon:yes gene_type:complete
MSKKETFFKMSRFLLFSMKKGNKSGLFSIINKTVAYFLAKAGILK